MPQKKHPSTNRRAELQERARALIAGEGGIMASSDLYAALADEGFTEDQVEYALTAGHFGRSKISQRWYRTLPPAETEHDPRPPRRDPASPEAAEFGKRLREMRQAAGMTLTDLADKVEMTREGVRKHELGLAVPSVHEAGRAKADAADKLIRVTPSELDLLRRIDRASPQPYPCVGKDYRAARQLRDRGLCEATSPEAAGGASFKLRPRGVEAVKQNTPPPAPKTDGFGDAIDPHGMYYVQDKRSIVGNCASWWRQDGKGYTCELDDAGAYTGAAVLGMRETDIPWPVNAVQMLAVEHVRVEALRGAVAERRGHAG